MINNRRDLALELAEELLTDIEYSRIPASDVLKKVTRLARLLDDTDALAWLSYEMNGYPTGGLDGAATAAAERSNRQAGVNAETGNKKYRTATLTRLQAEIQSRTLQLQTAQDSSSSSNQLERTTVSGHIADLHENLGKVLGAIYGYVLERQIELRFGAAVEDAFLVVRNEVDARIAMLVPGAATKFAAAFENAASGNPEQWANAAAACRRLLKEIADELRPPGDPVGNREMTDDKYINRLIDWIANQKVGGTLRDVVTSDLADFGARIDAFADAGHKGAHDKVTQYEASRFITGTYLLVGDILRLWAEVTASLQVQVTLTADGTVTSAELPVADSSDLVSDEQV